MKVFELGDSLTTLSYQGLAQEEIVVVIDGVEYEIEKAVNENGELKLVTSRTCKKVSEYSELM